MIGGLQDSPSVILAVIAAALVGALAAAGVGDKLTTVLVAIAATTLLTGVFLLAMGFFKLGVLVRFIPYPVVGGFLAGTGWLLAPGSFSVMTDFLLTLPNIPALLQPDQLILWVPGVLFALALVFGLRRINHFLAMPGILIGAIVVFYLALPVTGTSIGDAIDQGLLLGGGRRSNLAAASCTGEAAGCELGGHPGAERQYGHHSHPERGQPAVERFRHRTGYPAGR